MQDFFRAIFWIIVAILLYIYFIYPLILSLLSFIVSRKKLVKTDHFPKISLIILAGNNNGFLKDKIENCLALEYPREKLEIIVAQYDSAEKTEEIVSNYFSKGVNLFNPVEKKGINNTINFCVADSKGEVIVFTDEKSLFDKFAIKNLARNFADPKTGAVTGSIRIADGKGNRLTAGEDLMEKFKRVVLYASAGVKSLTWLNSEIFAVRKEGFVEIDNRKVPGSIAIPLGMPKKFKSIYEPTAVIYRKPELSLKTAFWEMVFADRGLLLSLRYLGKIFMELRFIKAFQILSFNLLFPLTGVLLALLFIVNIFLFSSDKPGYIYTFGAQICFYSAGVVGVSKIAQYFHYVVISGCLLLWTLVRGNNGKK